MRGGKDLKQLAITGNNRIEIIEYEVRPLGPHEVLVRTEIASGKHGTASAILDGSNSVGVRFDQEMRLFVDDPGAKGSFPTREHPWNLGTSGVGVIEQVGSEVSRWKIGDRVFGLMGIKETNIVHEEGLWELGSLDPLSARRDGAGVRGFSFR